ncbi:MAG: lysophospholipid acyltransferase family protein [Chitinophagaceae bacterium]
MYYVVYGFLWLISLLPLRVLYLFSECLYGLAYYIVKYRKKVVFSNLQIAFPEKTEMERVKIAKKFYRNFIDMFMETIKMLSISERQLKKRFAGNWEVANALYPTGKSVQFHVGHNFNWEWGNMVLTGNTLYKLVAVYMPFSNKTMERLFYNMRTRTGAIFIRATHMKEDFLPHKNTQHILGLIADQSPGNPGNAWWFNFFGKPTPFLKGPAKGAILNNTAVVFAFVHKPRRGYYEAVFELATENAASLTEQELTHKFVTYMEKVIRQYPDMWLWSHRRWKWDWKPEFGEIIA